MQCAARAHAVSQQGHQVVVVVSAMGRTTDHLLDLARQVSHHPGRVELDTLMATGEQVSTALMAMALKDHGADAICLTGRQLGITTDNAYGRARVQSVDRDGIQAHLDAGRVVVAAGFQGVTNEGHITTLGRGGSDITAVVLAATLGVGTQKEPYSNTELKSGGAYEAPSGTCEILTDVDGIYSADPRHVTNARRLDEIPYELMVELATLGAAVVHPRAVMIAQRYGVPVHVRHSALPGPGTQIVKESHLMEEVAVIGGALTPDLVRIHVRGLPGDASAHASFYERLDEADLLIHDLSQHSRATGDPADSADSAVRFTVARENLQETREMVDRALADYNQVDVHVEIDLARVSVVGAHLGSSSKGTATMLSSLAEAGINVSAITTTPVKISCLVTEADGPRALKVIHDAFRLDTHPQQRADTETRQARAN
jgi:aspartate kinase